MNLPQVSPVHFENDLVLIKEDATPCRSTKRRSESQVDWVPNLSDKK